MTLSTLNDDWRQVVALLPGGWRRWADEHFLCLSQPTAEGEERAKLRDPELQLRLILHYVGRDASLVQTVTEAAAAGLVEVSSPALHYRMRTAAPWLAQILSAVLDQPALTGSKGWGSLRRIFCTDASTVQRPGAKGTTARVHYRLHLPSLLPEQVLVTDAHKGEMRRNFTLAPGDLDLLDRCSCTAADLGYARDHEAHVIVRYNRTTLPLFKGNGQKIAAATVVARVTKQARQGHAKSFEAWVHPEAGAPIPVRICFLRLDARGPAQAEARLRRERDAKDLKAEDLDGCRFVVVVTTVPKAWRTDARVIELSRQRWQVELQIKRDKSLGHLGRLPCFRDDVIRSWRLAKLLLLALCRKVLEPELSPPDHAALAQDAA
jgi:hypothetical protein